jgi:uncharacterized C2H2 Zn-finger protein
MRTPSGHDEIEFPHTHHHLRCPACDHQATHGPVLHPETHARLVAGDQFGIVGSGHTPGNPADALAAYRALYARNPEDIALQCPRCGHAAHPRHFGAEKHLEEAR